MAMYGAKKKTASKQFKTCSSCKSKAACKAAKKCKGKRSGR